MNWYCKPFDELSPHEVYNILKLRSEVFVVEQNCVFLDADSKDFFCHHIMCIEHDKLIGYTRILPPGVSYVESSIGRVVTSLSARKTGIGKMLMQKSIESLYALYGKVSIKIGAQLYLKEFYESFAFKQSSDIYIEDDIEHIEMTLQNNA